MPRLDLDDASCLHVAHPRLAAARSCQRHRHARRLETSHGRAGPVYGIDDEHQLGWPALWFHEPAILRVDGDTRRSFGDHRLHLSLGLLVDREGDVAALAPADVRSAGVCAQGGQHARAQALGEVDDEVAHAVVASPVSRA